MSVPSSTSRRRCECGVELAPALLVCPSCDRLVHARELERLAAAATAAEAADPRQALVEWRRALELLPADSRQARIIAERITTLRERAGGKSVLATDAGPKPGTLAAKILGPLGVVGALIWKLKFLIVLAFSKLKFLLLGLSKAGSAFSMLLSFGVYWAAWGWPLAAGLIVSIYLHELGHVAAMKRLGMPVEAPMFVPGLGAYIRLRQAPVDAVEDARIGLAGPIWGLGAALAAWGVFVATGAPIWAAIAKLGAWINLFNLFPVWQLDGGRAFRALSRKERMVALAVVGGAYWLTREGLLVLVAIGAVMRIFGPAPERGHVRTLVEYSLLVGSLTALAAIAIPGLH